jgi:opacity protein-like surface antigen
MGNGYYDMHLGGGVDFYATAGVGIAQVAFHDVNSVYTYDSMNNVLNVNPDPGYNDHEVTLAYQLGAGLAFPLSQNLKLDLRYRYFATTDFTDSSGMNSNVVSHSALLGLRVEF